MKFYCPILALAFCCVASAQYDIRACFPVSQDQLTGRDLRQVPGLGTIPENAKFGFSPVPGARRVVPANEMVRIAREFGINASFTEPVCFAWPMQSLEAMAIRQAMRRGLSGLDPQIDLAKVSHTAVPVGELVFPLAGLSAYGASRVIWNGYVRYGEDHKFNVWAEVRLSIRTVQVVATHPIREGQKIGPGDVRAEQYQGAYRPLDSIRDIRDALGECATRPLPSGVPLTKAMLISPVDVEQNQLVSVHISCGAAQVDTQGIAAETGRTGDVIRVRNLKTGRIFRARIDRPGEVTVVAGSPGGLVVEDKKS